LPFFLVITVTKTALLGLGMVGGALTGKMNQLGGAVGGAAKKPLAQYQAEKKQQYDAKIKSGGGLLGRGDPRKWASDASDKRKANRTQATADYRAAAVGAYMGDNEKLKGVSERAQIRYGSYTGDGRSVEAMRADGMSEDDINAEMKKRTDAGTYTGTTDPTELAMETRLTAGGMSAADASAMATQEFKWRDSSKKNRAKKGDSRSYVGRKRSTGIGAANKEERELMEGISADMEMRYGNNTAGLSAEFQNALTSGDAVKTKALTNMLVGRGSEGIKQISSSLKGAEAGYRTMGADQKAKYDQSRQALIKSLSTDVNNREVGKKDATLATWARNIGSSDTSSPVGAAFAGKTFDEVSNTGSADATVAASARAAQRVVLDDVVTNTGDMWKQSGSSLETMLTNTNISDDQRFGRAYDMISDAKHSRNGAEEDVSKKARVALAINQAAAGGSAGALAALAAAGSAPIVGRPTEAQLVRMYDRLKVGA
ncbi:hypothetical protein FWH13_01235, partial [Candidatus Saccharibacteria bacterium]|nr:hypothetical protein [Candidatus Saccharibacteria bacterium]